VERILSMVDGVILLVDASEGAMPQTKFVTGKALALGLRPIVVVNKVDRPDERIQEVLDEVFDLFVSLEATDEQLDFPVLYASGRNGYAGEDPSLREGTLAPLFKKIVEHVPPPSADPDGPFKFLVTCSTATISSAASSPAWSSRARSRPTRRSMRSIMTARSSRPAAHRRS
jgi:GTP-binding protein